ncbi:MAG: glycoside hydrolase family 127 protein, partial [Vicinamibacteria bacterium]
MRPWIPAVLLCAACQPKAESPLRAVPFENVKLTDSFWRPRLSTNRTVTIPHILRQNEETGRVDNFRKAAGVIPGEYQGRRFNDTDVYKGIEAASYALAQEYDAALDAEVDELIVLIEGAQEDDGYLFPARTIDPEKPAPGVGDERWVHESAGSHELYNAGHLIEAAVAHYRATGKRSFLDVAIRFADLVDRDFGPEARRDVPGHEEIELALVELADATGDARYVELARFFLDERGREHDGEPYPEGTSFAIYNDRSYKQDHVPVVDQKKAAGHAVRATYLYTGMADVLARTGAPGYRESLESIWKDVVATKLYLTGGIGSRDTFESFGDDYELPNGTAYTETCAAIGNDLWNHRMFLASGEARFLDVMERVLYNGALSGVSVKGDTFFYTNPLESEGGVERAPYFEVACCPANLARLLAHLPGFIYAQRG